MNPVDVVLKFLERVKQHDAEKLAELMAEDHVFIDPLGQSVRGREKMRAGRKSYFAFCPDYWVFARRDLPARQPRRSVWGGVRHDCGEWKTSGGE